MKPHIDSQDHPLTLSKRLGEIIAADGPDRLSFSELAAQLHARAWGGLLLIFAAINVLPLPPATSWFFALPLMIVAGQMALGRSKPWFPARIDRRGVTKHELGRLVSKMEWLERRVERIFKPRMPKLTGDTATRVIGVVSFLLAIVAAIPIPLFHMAPAAAIGVFALALIYRDGALVIAGAIASVLAIIADALVIGSGVAVLSYGLSWLGL